MVSSHDKFTSRPIPVLWCSSGVKSARPSCNRKKQEVTAEQKLCSVNKGEFNKPCSLRSVIVIGGSRGRFKHWPAGPWPVEL